jgi:hypothetical protein
MFQFGQMSRLARTFVHLRLPLSSEKITCWNTLETDDKAPCVPQCVLIDFRNISQINQMPSMRSNMKMMSRVSLALLTGLPPIT